MLLTVLRSQFWSFNSLTFQRFRYMLFVQIRLDSKNFSITDLSGQLFVNFPHPLNHMMALSSAAIAVCAQRA